MLFACLLLDTHSAVTPLAFTASIAQPLLHPVLIHQAAEDARRADEERAAEVRRGNPLLDLAGGGAAAAAAGGEVDFGVKRRWDDDVVFKNQTRNEVKAARRFINDTVRSDFHRRFLDRYMK